MNNLKIPVLDLNPEIEMLWDELNTAFQNVLRSGQFIMGAEVKKLEQEIAEYLGVKHAIGVNSGTDALVIGLKAMGIKEGDEVLTTPFSFFATAESISIVGAKPVFVDIDPATFNINPALLKEKLTSRTKAIMPVHLYGHPAAMGEIMAFADEHGLQVIEDCAQSFGTTYYADNQWNGYRAGTIGKVGAYSFFPSKNLGAYGDGGMLVTNDDAVADVAGMLRVHGAKKKYHNEILGYNSRLDTLQAAILRVKFPHIEANNNGRYAAALRYNELLKENTKVITPAAPKGHVFHQYTIRLLGVNRDEVQKKLQERGISSMVYYPIPQDQLPIYKGQYEPNPISNQLGLEVLSLPIWPQISEEMQEYVVSAIQEVLAEM